MHAWDRVTQRNKHLAGLKFIKKEQVATVLVWKSKLYLPVHAANKMLLCSFCPCHSFGHFSFPVCSALQALHRRNLQAVGRRSITLCARRKVNTMARQSQRVENLPGQFSFSIQATGKILASFSSCQWYNREHISIFSRIPIPAGCAEPEFVCQHPEHCLALRRAPHTLYNRSYHPTTSRWPLPALHSSALRAEPKLSENQLSACWHTTLESLFKRLITFQIQLESLIS